MQKEAISVKGFSVYADTKAHLYDSISERLQNGERTVLFALNPLKVVAAKKDTVVKDALCSANYLIPDGVGILFSASFKGHHFAERITGVDLLDDILEMANKEGKSIFVYGATEQNIQAAINNISQKYPQLTVAGFCNGYEYTEEQATKIIAESKASILICALSSPKQELYIYRHIDEMKNIQFAMGVGGAIDILSGAIKRAPLWVRKIRLEWLYRMIRQPRRFKNLKNIFLYLFQKG